MFHRDIHGIFQDTEEVPLIGEGQPMQSMDEQPLRPFNNEQTNSEQPAQQAKENHITSNFQEPQPEQAQNSSPENQPSEQVHRYQGRSEQILFSYPPAPTAHQEVQGTSTPTEGTWNTSARPEYYPPAGTVPPSPRPDGLFYRQAEVPFGQPYPQSMPFGASYSPSPSPKDQPDWSPYAQPGLVSPLPAPAPPRHSRWRTGALLGLILLLALVFGTGLFAGWQFGHSGNSTITSSPLEAGNNTNVTVPQLTDNNADAVREAVISKVRQGIVQINVTNPGQQALGSGVIIDRRGYVVTNNHVVAGSNNIQVTLSNSTILPAQVVGTDPADDLAVIKVTPPASGLATLTLGDSARLQVGQEVLALGSPLGNSGTVTSGIVSALNRNISEGQNGPTLPDAIQTDAPINPGNSGGALVDLQGNLVGMPTLNAIDTEFNTPANGLGFAIPVNRIRFIAQQIIADGHVSHTGRSILGVTVTNVDQNVATQNHLSVNAGVLVVNISSAGPAASAGLQANDVIVQLDNKTVNSTTDLSSALLRHKPGDTVAVKVYRGSQQLSVNVTLGELPVS